MFHQQKKCRITRLGFTLIELLIGIAIIGIMAGMVLYTLAGAQEDAKRAKTRATIAKLNAIVLQRLEEYRYRSVKLPIPRDYMVRSSVTGKPLIRARDAAKVRTVLLRDLLRMEMPDRQSDLTFVPTNIAIPVENYGTLDLDSFEGRYSSRDYNVLRSYFGLPPVSDPYKGSIAISPNPLPAISFDSSECLYAIVAHSMIAGGSALENFHASEIGDTDSDGFPEFIDAWGRPIAWLRWPAAYPSELNRSYALTPDVFDPYRTDPQWQETTKPWTLIPLIISAGPDGDFGFTQGSGNTYSTVYAETQINGSVFINPYAPSTGSPREGAVATNKLTTIADNITNHDILLE